VRWGSQTMKVEHLDAGKSFFVGDGTDFAVADERIAIVRGSYVVVPPGASATVTKKGELATQLVGPQDILLVDGMEVVLEVGTLTFEISTVRKGKVLPFAFSSGALGTIALSFLGHAAIVASFAMFMPKMGADDADAMNREQMMLMQKYLSAAAERE